MFTALDLCNTGMLMFTALDLCNTGMLMCTALDLCNTGMLMFASRSVLGWVWHVMRLRLECHDHGYIEGCRLGYK